MLFWFFPALNNDTEAPVTLWLDGGPGETGLFGLYTVNGPYIVYQNLSVGLRPQTWNQEFHIIYVDNPVGTGFSFMNDDGGYARSEDQVADDLYEFLQQFFMLFPEYSSNDFYVLGESYAGKFVAAISYKIHSAGPPSQVKFKGLSIGNGFCDPKTQMNYSDHFYQLGLVDSRQAAVIKLEAEKAVKDIDEENFNAAFSHLNSIVKLIPDLTNPNYLLKFAGYNTPYNFLYTEKAKNLCYFIDYIELPEFRKAIHIGNTHFSDGKKVFKFLSQDVMKTVRPKLVPLMNNYKTLIYNGQLDLSMPFTLMKDFLSTVDWKFSDDLKKAERKIWKLDGKVAGYVHTVGDFYLALVRLAGHLVPYDQPDFALDLITRFIKGIPYA
ncbi:unnamed protein product [Larinioides sclopetarius]|uniref:Carboxypeptidase n=1 Tax=Larinioides sclopetarius TaxID=280406 RepID=A0AAV2BW49_9ARAC